jgi:non-ribosomal peptide synthetase component E (peptide arylation enzyme)
MIEDRGSTFKVLCYLQSSIFYPLSSTLCGLCRFVAFVSLKPNARCAAEELQEYCKQHLAHYKYPRRVNILPELPKGATGKVLKSELRAHDPSSV